MSFNRCLVFRFAPTEALYDDAYTADTAEAPPSPGLRRELASVPVHPAAAVLSYGIGVMEGLKAHRGDDGRIRIFRAADHATRFRRSAERLEMPPYPAAKFRAAVRALVQATAPHVPPPEEGSLYVRAMAFADEPMLGLTFPSRIRVLAYASAVGSFFAAAHAGPGTAGRRGLRLATTSVGRAARGGSGGAKAIGNYAICLRAKREAFAAGCDDALFLDAASRSLVEEGTGTNVFAVLEPGDRLVTPPAGDTFLPGVSRDSAIVLSRARLGRAVVERPLPLAEAIETAREMFVTGTGSGIAPVATIRHEGRDHAIGGSGGGGGAPGGEVAAALLSELRAIQLGRREDTYGWTEVLDL